MSGIFNIWKATAARTYLNFFLCKIVHHLPDFFMKSRHSKNYVSRETYYPENTAEMLDIKTFAVRILISPPPASLPYDIWSPNP